jgi:hypothetical protein
MCCNRLCPRVKDHELIGVHVGEIQTVVLAIQALIIEADCRTCSGWTGSFNSADEALATLKAELSK